MREDINLLPSIKARKIGGRAANNLRNVAVGLLLFVATTSMTVFFLIVSSPLPSLKKEQEGAVADLKKYNRELEFLTVTRDRLKHASKILSERKRFDNAFVSIQGVLPSEASIIGYELAIQNVSFTISTLSLAPLDVFLRDLKGVVIEGKAFRSLTLSSLVFDEAKKTYELTVSLTLL